MSGFEKIIEDLPRLVEQSSTRSGQVRPMAQDHEGVFVYLPKLTDFQKKEIEFHDAIHQDEEEIHQLNTVRNKFYHDYFKKWLYKLSKDSVILEIGGGSGFDLIPLLKKGYSAIASDISLESVKFIKNKINSQYSIFNNQIIYLVADGQNLPLADDLVEATFVVATFHHFENQKKALAEIQRVTKKNGLIILAMEPSRFMMWFTKLFAKSKKLRIHQGHSAADEVHQGYSETDLLRLIRLERSREATYDSRLTTHDLRLIKLKRVWLLLGFLHYGLEAIFRLFKLKKRLKVPQIIEWVLIILDEILLKIPIINQLNWHWIVILKKV